MANLTLSSVEAVATSTPEGDADRVSVRVGDRLVLAIDLVARALDRPTVDVSTREAVTALLRLGLHIEGFDPPAEELPRTDEAEVRATETAGQPVAVAKPPGGTDKRLIGVLRRHRGEWVAVRDKRVVASGSDIRSVVERAGISAESPASVFFVPTTDVASTM